MALALAEQRHEDVGTGHLIAAGGLHMDRGALHDALEAGGRLRVAGAVGRQAGEILVEEFGEVFLDFVDIDAAGAQHRDRVGIVDQPEQQMLEGGVFMLALGREGKGAVQGLFKIAREHGSKPFLHAETRRSNLRASPLPARPAFHLGSGQLGARPAYPSDIGTVL